VLLALGLLGGAAAAAMAFMKKSAPKDDPWTTPLADPYVATPNIATPNGRHSAASPVDEATATTTMESEIIDSLDDAGTPSLMEPAGDADLTDKDGVDNKDATDKDDTKKSSTNKNGTDKNQRT